MSESKPDRSVTSSDVKAPNIFERAKEEIEAILHTEKSSTDLHHKETHGKRADIDENTPVNDVKAPNVFERVKEEIEALVQAIHPKKESQTRESRNEPTKPESKPEYMGEKEVKAPNLIERVKEEVEAILHKNKSPHRHDKETHGRSDDIDKNTPINEVKGPNVFERAKEEIEAFVQTIHPKKDSAQHLVSSPKKGGEFRSNIGKGMPSLG